MNIRRFGSFFAAMSMAAFLTGTAAQGDNPSYRASIEKWRQDYEASLKADSGWLTVCGLFWLQEGENRFGSDAHNDVVLPAGAFPPEAGTFEVHGGKVSVQVKAGVTATLDGKPVTAAELVHDSPEGTLRFGEVSLLVHASGDRFAVRVRDKDCKLRREFKGLNWFPVNERYRVTAHFVPYERAKSIETQNLAGDTVKLTSPGYVTFTLGGGEYRLEAALDDPAKANIFLVFRDLTSGTETYAAARFLDTEAPKGGVVVLDFNKAYNPPCAYNPYATCPVPPAANRLGARIEAGEKNYHAAHPALVSSR